MEVSGNSGWKARLTAKSEPAFSVLRERPIRPLHIVLAHKLARARDGDPYNEILRRLYDALPIPGQAECLAELALLRGEDRVLEFPKWFDGTRVT